VKHRPGIEQLQVRLQSAAEALQRAEEKHPPRVIEQQIILGISDDGGDLAHQLGVGDDDTGDTVGRGGRHVQLLKSATYGIVCA
jgi:hypothetical protein